MTADEILLDAEERMEKAVQVLKNEPDRHSHRPGQPGPGRFAAGRSLRLADADQATRLGRRARADADRDSPLRSRHASRTSRRRSSPATWASIRRTTAG